MRWIDIVLPPRGTCQETDRRLDEARALVDGIPALQDRHGLDAPAVTGEVERIGRLLFQAVTAHQAGAFRDDPHRDGATTPGKIDRVGYHIVAADDRVGLPWQWLHSGMGYLIERSPIASADHGSHPTNADPMRVWMHRQQDALLDPDHVGHDDRTQPEILFVPGHGKDEIRRLMFREAEGIDHALAELPAAAARLRIPGAVTPGLLAARAMLYQVLHFAAPTSQPPEVSQAGENRWLAGLMAAAGEPGADPDVVDDMVGLEKEILGVDPVEAALDQALESYVHRGAAVPAGAGSPVRTTAGDGWLLDDGPIAPEHLGRDGCLPPLVFSNSWCSLHWLGQRFTRAGASAFVGTSMPLFSRPARLFAGLFYGALGRGRCAGEAHREAALALRERLGPEHPAWLAHGVQGYATLRLEDL
ncbi:hypothetical protein GF314_12210 [bacterium]|nr:hypothetical protein [bacterium]